jgi:hypothetical protein
MWDIDAKAIAGTARDRGDLVLVMSAEEAAPWRKATEPVIAAWQKQMKDRKLDGGKLLAGVEALLAKYAEEPEPDAPQPARPEEPEAVTEPQQSQPQPQPTAQIKPEGFTRPRADAPAAEAAAQPAPPLRPSLAPAPTVSAAPPAPVVKPAPVVVPSKELDIPL